MSEFDFETPLLDSVTHPVRGRTFTLFEFSAEAYYEHIFTEKVVELMRDKEPGTTSSGDAPERIPPEEVVTFWRDSKNAWSDYVACSMSPGIPEKTVPEISLWLRRNLKGSDLEDLFGKVQEVNGLGKGSTDQTDNLSEDSQESTASP